jgi:hypothetical protein
MVVKLPCWVGCRVVVVGWWVRPIFENSTACTCHMPIFVSADHLFGWWGSFLDQFMDVSLIFVFGQIELAWLRCFPGGVVHSFFMESLILAQDERWRRA